MIDLMEPQLCEGDAREIQMAIGEDAFVCIFVVQYSP